MIADDSKNASALELAGQRDGSVLTATAAGVTALVLLDLLGVQIKWAALRWDASTTTQVARAETRDARERVRKAANRLTRLARAATSVQR